MDAGESILRRFSRLEHALIDASSLIYIDKAGFLRELAASIALHAPQQIVAETGFTAPPVERIEASAPLDDGEKNDDILVRCALERGWPIISEDRQILHRMKREGMEYFNALMMLHCLLYRRCITPSRHRIHLERLHGFARYSAEVWAYGDSVHLAIRAQQDAVRRRSP